MFSREKVTVAYTLERCPLCNMERKRKFKNGDVLFSKTTPCGSCDGTTIIEKIFGEQLE